MPKRHLYTLLGITMGLVLAQVIFSSAHAQDSSEESVLEARNDLLAQGLRPDYQKDLERFPDIPFYDYKLTLTVDDSQAVLAGRGRIEYTNTTGEELSEIVLRLYPNLNNFGGDATLADVRVNGRSVAPSLDETRSVAGLRLARALAPSEKAEITFNYNLVVYRGLRRLYNQLSFLDTELAFANALPLLSVYEPDAGWWDGSVYQQGDAVYSETANFDVTLTVPDYVILIASGSKVDEETDKASGTFTHRYVGPLMRDFAFMASAKYQVISAQYEDIQIDVHYLTNGEDGAAKALQWTLDAMKAYSEAFGDYVYNDLDVVQTLTAAGGIEYPGLVVMSSDYWYSSTPWFERIMVHEVAHQWWYSMVGNNQPYFTWVDESLTDYCILYYMLATYGEEAYNNLVVNFQHIYGNYETESNTVGVIGLPTSGYSSAAFLPILYRKGAVFFHTLAQLMGQDKFELALRNYLSTYRYGIAGPDDLQTAFEEVMGEELDDLFIKWVGYSN